ncbi:MAG: SIS domain-containing protein [Clostridiales bacterium]|jgi:glucosamine--fructose-6-phosphate aminotransferase (isomerizing)|nr:SIS domain-containing protein [Clostridiales bacterium]
MSTLMEKEIFEQAKVLSDCLAYNGRALDELVDIINKGDFAGIMIAARGSSDNAGTYFKYAMESLTGIPVALAAPSVVTMYGKELKLKNYLVIGVSQSGAAEDVMAVLSEAKRQGAFTAALTNNLGSKMASMADCHLYCNAGEEKSVAATKTFLSQMYLLGQLAARAAGDAEVIRELDAIPRNLEKVYALNDHIKGLAESIKGISWMIVLARGLNYAVAQETSLKLQETCYVNARPYAASDFLHGPFALVDENATLLLIAPSGPSQGDMLKLKERILAAEGKAIIYTDKEEFAQGCMASAILPVSGSDYANPFYNALVSQLLACNLSLARGLNPDSPRGLKKVTITK